MNEEISGNLQRNDEKNICVYFMGLVTDPEVARGASHLQYAHLVQRSAAPCRAFSKAPSIKYVKVLISITV